MTNELAIRILMGDVLGTSEQTHEAIKMAVIALTSPNVPERKVGKWVKVGHRGRTYKCNRCGNYLDFDGVNAGRGDANFCPNCGAIMDERREDERTD